jgi:hypothetical protein
MDFFLFLARPVDEATINYLTDIGRILSGESTIDPDEKSDILCDCAMKLNVTEKELEACKGKNIRITVRQIMKMKYPETSADFKFAQVDRDYIEAARGEKE